MLQALQYSQVSTEGRINKDVPYLSYSTENQLWCFAFLFVLFPQTQSPMSCNFISFVFSTWKSHNDLLSIPLSRRCYWNNSMKYSDLSKHKEICFPIIFVSVFIPLPQNETKYYRLPGILLWKVPWKREILKCNL